MVYPGGVHNRFNHALGAMHLMRQALDTLRRKCIEITEDEYQGALMAILLHDIGHGPFSHALEFAIVPDMHHEEMSLAIMHRLNAEFGGELTTAIAIFEGNYPKKFLHQLVSSQLDMDRMDYLIRDSFFTGVVEGTVGMDRLIRTLNVYQGQLVIESKGIYSAENFVVARRLMYWQVYLHKTALSAERMAVNILKRAKECYHAGISLFLDDDLGYFFRLSDMRGGITPEIIEQFARLDDVTLEYHIRQWTKSPDKVLSNLCQRFIDRSLLKIKIQNTPIAAEIVEDYRTNAANSLGLTQEEAAYFVFTGTVSNQAYLKNSDEPIYIWYKNNELQDLATASDMENIGALAAPVVKHYMCHPAW